MTPEVMTMTALPKLIPYSAPWTDATFHFLKIGRRRAVRACMWFGGGMLGSLRCGYERQLHRGMALVRVGSGYELRGPKESLLYFLRVLGDQERCDRQEARR